MTCRSCGYRFALNPKKAPNLTDRAFRAALDRVSSFGQHSFTYYQLYAQIYRLIRKKRQKGCLVGAIFSGIVAVIFFFVFGSVLASIVNIGMWLPFLLASVAVVLALRFFKKGASVAHGDVVKVIGDYQSLHPLTGMVGGNRFRDREEQPDPELLRYAPERILVVERDDVAEMLLLNRFHSENRTLVVSANKYPRGAFEACRAFLREHPDLPVAVLHDASPSGLGLKSRLLADPEWKLEGHPVEDLGLFPEDVDRLKDPVWLPAGGKSVKKVKTYGSARENLDHGLMMPVDLAPPRNMMYIAATAMVLGVALLSPELMAQMQQQSASGGAAGGGGGYG